jgi:hypothetical protein
MTAPTSADSRPNGVLSNSLHSQHNQTPHQPQPAPHRSLYSSSSPARTPRSGTPVAGAHLALAGNKNYKVQERTGYQDTRFLGKEEQLAKVVKTLYSKGFIPADLVETEVSNFFPFDPRFTPFLLVIT